MGLSGGLLLGVVYLGLLYWLRVEITQEGHAVTIPIGRRVERRTQGGIDITDAPPFEILAPNPDTRPFTPGEPLPVAWSPLPGGSGPLEVRFSSRNPETNIQTLVTCTVVDPDRGQAVLPAAMTAQFSEAPGAFNQLTLEWGIHTRGLPGPNRGTFEHGASVILNFSR